MKVTGGNTVAADLAEILPAVTFVLAIMIGATRRAVRRIWVGGSFTVWVDQMGGSGGSPRKNFGFKVPQPLFFLVLLVQGDKKGVDFRRSIISAFSYNK